ncbi:MAG: VOC family protein [Gammaproteobacteria bacterium]|nr:VOC family protein [Gammaproteobacteria bacterium]
MSDNPVGWFEIYVQDLRRARQFYETVLQLPLQQLASPGLEMWAFPIVSGGRGASGALVRAPGVPSGGNSTLVYFSCADCAEAGARVVPAGGRLLRERISIGEYGFVVLAYDTEGNLFGLHSRE